MFVFLGKYGRHTSLPFLRPPLTTALLTLGKAHQVTLTATLCMCGILFFYSSFLQYHEFSFTLQNAMLGNGLVLQNLLHMQLAQQQLLHIKDKRISSVRSLFICMCVWVCLDHLHSGRLGIRARRSSCEHQHVSYVPSYFYHRHFSRNETKHPQHHAE